MDVKGKRGSGCSPDRAVALSPLLRAGSQGQEDFEEGGRPGQGSHGEVSIVLSWHLDIFSSCIGLLACFFSFFFRILEDKFGIVIDLSRMDMNKIKRQQIESPKRRRTGKK